MGYIPLPGDVVRLTESGFQELGAAGFFTSREATRQAERMTVIYVGENMTEPEPTFVIEVDQPLINEALLTSDMIELIERPPVPLPNKVLPPILSMDEAIEQGIATVELSERGNLIITVKSTP